MVPLELGQYELTQIALSFSRFHEIIKAGIVLVPLCAARWIIGPLARDL